MFNKTLNCNIKILLLQIFLYIASSSSQALTFPDYKTHPCLRTCTGEKRICKYNFTIETIYTMEPNCLGCPNIESDCYERGCVVADGTSREIYTINRMFPGPMIQVCQGDRVIVDVKNNFGNVITSFHWHGIRQRNTQWMDGVPYITQCPILPLTTLRYDFMASDSGTHFYHAHTGFQRINGLAGALIVRRPSTSEPNGALYDQDLSEHTILFNEWFKNLPDVFYYTWYRIRVFNTNPMDAILINGFGTSLTNNVPAYKFNVTQGVRYRFRLISNGAENCPIQVNIDNHTFTIISSDGDDIKPIEVKSLYINSGERYDIVVNANQAPSNYWIRFTGYGYCNELQGGAVLQYSGTNSPPISLATDSDPLTPKDKTINCFYEKTKSENCSSVAQLQSYSPLDDTLKGKPDYKLYLGFEYLNFARRVDQGVADDKLFTHTMNRISFVMPEEVLLQYPYQELCNPENINCTGRMCECVHGYQIPYNALVEVFMVNVDTQYYGLTHPMHLHGYTFNVVSEGRFPETNLTIDSIIEKDNQGLLQRNLIDPPLKDTVAVGDYEYVIIRFIADNTGFWFFHSHNELDWNDGLSAVLKVGDGVLIPPNLQKC